MSEDYNGTYSPAILVGTDPIGGMPEVLRFRCHFVKVYDDGRIRNYGTGSYDREAFSDLAITAQCDRTGGTYGWAVEYRDVYAVDLRTAETMTKTLRRVTREMDKLSERFGHADSFPAYVARVGAALKVDRFGWKVDAGNGWSYDDGEYRWTDATSTAYHLNQLVHDHQKDHAAS